MKFEQTMNIDAVDDKSIRVSTANCEIMLIGATNSGSTTISATIKYEGTETAVTSMVTEDKFSIRYKDDMGIHCNADMEADGTIDFDKYVIQCINPNFATIKLDNDVVFNLTWYENIVGVFCNTEEDIPHTMQLLAILISISLLYGVKKESRNPLCRQLINGLKSEL